MIDNISNDDSEFSPSSSQERTPPPLRPAYKKAPKLSNVGRLIWTYEENAGYLRFLEANCELFRCYRKRRHFKVFCLLSKEIRTRTINQIKSHHQKMLKKHLTIEAVIAFLKPRLANPPPPTPPPPPPSPPPP